MEFKLTNGLRVVHAHMPHVRTVAVGVFVGAGSRLETAENNGISHFIEHMLFKGTSRRSAKDIACEMDAIGGNLNAYTTREYTCYYAKAIDEEFERIFDILSDMYLSSSFHESDVELERSVILEEISMYEDSPEDVAVELLNRIAWSNDALGYSISGSQTSVKGITREALVQFWEKHYTAENTVIAIAGNIHADEALRVTEKYFGTMRRGTAFTNYHKVSFHGGFTKREKDIEQAHLCIAWPGLPQETEDRYAAAVLCNAFGGGMSSRLFQKIREEKGLAYSVYAVPDAFKNAGMFMVYAGTSLENAETVREMIFDEASSIAKHGLTVAEIARGKSQMRSGFIMGLESASGRMQSMGRSVLLHGTVRDEETVLKGIENITQTQIKILAQSTLTAETAEAFLCPKK